VNNGQPCTSNLECATGFCTDGLCCQTACDGQCEACDLPEGDAGFTGKCQAVTGEPRGSRPACDNAGVECGGRCDGTTTAKCTYPTELETCGTATCKNGVASQPVCDGQGSCGNPVETKCVKFVCGPTACKTACDSDADCAGEYKCDTAKRDCVPVGAQCDGDHTLVSTNSPPTDCAPYRCNATNVCLSQCTSRADCVAKMTCTSDGKCEPEATAPASPDSGCGCRVSGAPAEDSDARLALLALLTCARWRSRRRHARAAQDRHT
jgi:MYXO-CTERM domain-containing protein